MALPPYASTGQRLWFWTFRHLRPDLPLPDPADPRIVPLSFNATNFFTFTPEMLSFDPAGYSLRHYRDFFTSSDWQSALWNCFRIAPVATLLAVTLGTIAAVGLASATSPSAARSWRS